MIQAQLTTPTWNEYLQTDFDTGTVAQSRKLYREAFRSLRGQIGDLVQRLRPHRVACLGSGFLNDLPLEVLIGDDRTVHLIDWLPDVSLAGLRGTVVRGTAENPECLACQLAKPEQYCERYGTITDASQQVCSEYTPMCGPLLGCDNYVHGGRPQLIAHDVTGGRATLFAQQLTESMRSWRNPEQAFKLAAQSCRSDAPPEHLPIEKGSIDFVTSSMLVSQFEHEPYNYFAKLLEEKFGRRRILDQEQQLRPAMLRLRNKLFAWQLEGHARELYRLVNRQHGRVYFSVELFRDLPANQTAGQDSNDQFYLVEGIPTVLQVMGQYFHFDFHHFSPAQTLQTAELAGGTSLLECLVMVPRPRIATNEQSVR